MSLTGIDKLKECPRLNTVKGNNDDGTVILTWTKVDGAEKYAVKRADSEKSDFEHIAWSKKTKFIDDTVEPYNTYHYKIMAWKKLEGKKTSTRTSSARAVIISDVKVPKNVQLTPDADGSINIRWDKVRGASKYIVLRRNSLCTDLLTVGITEKCSFKDECVVSGQPYYYGVQAVNVEDGVEKPGKWSKQIPTVHLDCGEILSCEASFGKKISLSFRIVAGADGYIVERSDKKDGGFCEVGRTGGQTSVEFQDKVPKSLKTYYYRVKALKQVNETEFISFASKKVAIKSR